MLAKHDFSFIHPCWQVPSVLYPNWVWVDSYLSLRLKRILVLTGSKSSEGKGRTARHNHNDVCWAHGQDHWEVRVKLVSKAEQNLTLKLKQCRKLFQRQAGGTVRELWELGKGSVTKAKLLKHEGFLIKYFGKKITWSFFYCHFRTHTGIRSISERFSLVHRNSTVPEVLHDHKGPALSSSHNLRYTTAVDIGGKASNNFMLTKIIRF